MSCKIIFQLVQPDGVELNHRQKKQTLFDSNCYAKTLNHDTTYTF
jgi:hypothetical protein